ncbi:MAG: glycoside hydrolase family 95 protein [Sphingobacteriaceae bacterium]|nr:glycoside hydrolase family 95 protein [Sphingobacteriaceae bacterium]
MAQFTQKKRNIRKGCTLFVMIVMHTLAFSQGSQFLKLWYDKPSETTWERALPVGNGRLAAMVYGNVARECLQLNEGTVWSGGPNRNDNPDALAALPEIRNLVFEGKQDAAQSLAGRKMSSKINGMKFQPVGKLFLDFSGHEKYTNYYRELDLERAVASSRYTVDGVTYRREIFASVPAQVIVVRLTADKPGKITFNASFSSQQRSKINTRNGELILSGVTADHEGIKGQVKFQSSVKVNNEGGSVSQTDSSLNIRGATSATIFLSIATNFVNYQDLSANEAERCKTYLNFAIKKSYPDLLKEHINSYQKYFNRVKLDLGTTEAMNFPTDIRVKNFASANDPHMVSLYYQFGRYLLISSSQPGGQPSTLQGLWNDRMDPPWDSKYTININTQMNYWPAEKTNLSEMHEPLIKMVKELSETGKETAKVMYGARGWMAHHNTDIWRITGPVDNIFWGVWSMGGAWLSQHAWEKYLYSGDKDYLRKMYPVLKGAAMFFVDDLVEDPRNHYLVINPGTSPENHPASRKSSFDAGTTMDNQIVFDMLSVAIRAAEVLKTDVAFADTLRKVRKRLPPMQIGKHGQLQEWIEDLDDPNDKHRHISHLYGLFPSNQVSPYRTPELFSASKATLTHRGDVSTGWSMGWKVNWWARMLDGNHAYKLISNQLSPVGSNGGGGGTYPNLFDAHAPFQIDGNFGCTSGITEMLMQSQDGALHLLPAVPDVWKTGKLSGIKARGGFEIVSLEWKDGKVLKAVIKSTLGGNCRLRLPNVMKLSGSTALKAATGKNSNPFYYTEETAKPIITDPSKINNMTVPVTVEYDLNTQPGKIYTLTI